MLGTKGKVAVGVLAVTLATGGVALATIPGEDGTITACYTESAFLLTPKGSLRVVDSPSQCRGNETALTWNQAGQPGPQGPEGPQGPPGELEGEAGGDLAGSYPNPQIASGAIREEHFGNEVIRGGPAGPIADESILGDDLADAAVDRVHIANDAIGSAQVENNSLTGDDIENGSIRGPDIGDLPGNIVSSLNIVDGSIVSQDLQPAADWQDITLHNVWSPWDDGPQCYRDILGIVHLRGIAVQFAEDSTIDGIGSIPCGGPAQDSWFQTTRLSGQFEPTEAWAHTVHIQSSGELFDWVPRVPQNGRLVLDGISYPTH